MSWRELVRSFHVNWDTVFNAVRMAVAYGLAKPRLDDVEAGLRNGGKFRYAMLAMSARTSIKGGIRV